MGFARKLTTKQMWFVTASFAVIGGNGSDPTKPPISTGERPPCREGPILWIAFWLTEDEAGHPRLKSAT
jgi:hypothetical protein